MDRLPDDNDEGTIRPMSTAVPLLIPSRPACRRPPALPPLSRCNLFVCTCVGISTSIIDMSTAATPLEAPGPAPAPKSSTKRSHRNAVHVSHGTVGLLLLAICVPCVELLAPEPTLEAACNPDPPLAACTSGSSPCCSSALVSSTSRLSPIPRYAAQSAESPCRRRAASASSMHPWPPRAHAVGQPLALVCAMAWSLA